jgi:glyceraldehyde 3-phosphate dehydrogenase
MAVKIAINGFGRIGRCFFRQACQATGIEIVAINDLTDNATLLHLLKHDSIHGGFQGEVKLTEDGFSAGSQSVKVLAERDPSNLPWGELGVDVVLESTGLFTGRDAASKHLSAGAKKVIISAPSKDPDLTLVMGVNEGAYSAESHHIISNASCTTNCLAPVAKIIDDAFGIESGLMTTIHSYTNDQKILDLPHKDLRRARAAAMNMIPTSTGAAQAVGKVLPHLNGLLTGMAIRVPTPNVSLVDVSFVVKKPTTIEGVNSALKKASQGSMKGILDFCEEPLVSGDFNGCAASSTVDADSTLVQNGTLIKVLSWYDNETGYSTRILDLVNFMFKS